MRKKWWVKFFIVELVFVMLMNFSTPSIAEDWFSIDDIRIQALDKWQQAYEVHGRTITVNVPVDIPDVNRAPVIKVRWHSPIEEESFRKLKEKYMAPQGENPQKYAASNAREEADDFYFSRVAFSKNTPFVLDEDKGQDMMSARWPMHDLFNFNINQSYAKNNPLTIKQADEITQHIIKENLGEEIPLFLDFPVILDPFEDRNTGIPLFEQGGYELHYRQIFHGIPILAEIRSSLVKGYQYNPNEHRGSLWGTPNAFAQVVSAEEYSIYVEWLEEKGVLVEDIPLISFDKIIPAYEYLINQGLIRNVYSLRFGYVMYTDTSIPDTEPWEYYLVPAWVATCELLPSAKDEPTEYDLRELVNNRATTYRVIVNAQTGELLDPFSMDPIVEEYPAIFQWP